MEIHDKKQLAAICIERLKKEGFAHVDDGALVIDVQEESDTKEIPPCWWKCALLHSAPMPA